VTAGRNSKKASQIRQCKGRDLVANHRNSKDLKNHTKAVRSTLVGIERARGKGALRTEGKDI